MKKIFGLLVAFFSFIQFTLAQQPESGGFDKSKLFFGGSLGLAFGTYTIVNVSPQVGYRFNPYFAAGAGVNYSYYGYTQYFSNGYTKYSQSYAGMNIFGRVFPIQQFFIQVQPELNYVWGNLTNYYSSGGGNGQTTVDNIPTQFVPSLMIGGGAAIPAGKGSIMISVLYDVVQNIWSPYYHQAVYGFGYSVGF